MRIVFACEKRGEALLLERRFDLGQLLLCFRQQGEIILLVCEIHEGQGVLIGGLQLFVSRYLVFQVTGALQDLLRALCVIPEAGLRCLHVELGGLVGHRLQPESLREILQLRFQPFQLKPNFIKLQHIRSHKPFQADPNGKRPILKNLLPAMTAAHTFVLYGISKKM